MVHTLRTPQRLSQAAVQPEVHSEIRPIDELRVRRILPGMLSAADDCRGLTAS